MRSRHGMGGIILVLVSGLLTILILIGAALVQVGRLNMIVSDATVAAAQAALAAEGGMDYAAARLWQEDGYPHHPKVVSSRGDDWQSRGDSVEIIGAMQNPSYSHGEFWIDVGAADGVYQPNQDDISGTDRDGDGRFSAWSGRLRGGDGPFSLPFSLKIESPGGKIPVNGSFLDDEDRDGLGGKDRQDTLFLPVNVGLVHVLNNLGALVLPSSHPRYWEIGTIADPVHYSVLGTDLIANRPLGGYRDERHLKEVISSLGGGTWYPPDAKGDPAGFREILPYLNLTDPEPLSPQWGLPWAWTLERTTTITPTPAIELTSASEVTLQAIWRYLSHEPVTLGWEWGPAEANDAASRLDPRTGNALPYSQSNLIIFPDEAEELANVSADYCRGGGRSWNGLYQRFLEVSESVFETAGLDRLTYPTAKARYAQAKADLAFMAITPDRHPHPECSPLGWSSWGLDRHRPTTVSQLQFQPYPCQVSGFGVQGIQLPQGGLGNDYTGNAPFGFGGPFMFGKPGPLPGTFRPSGRFLVGTMTKGREERGLLVVSEAVFFGSQEDFENKGKGLPALAGAFGIEPVNDDVWNEGDTGRRRILADEGGRMYRTVASLPRFNQDSYPLEAGPQVRGYSRSFGALALSPLERGPDVANYYWPLGERDVEIVADGNFISEPAPGVVWQANGDDPVPIDIDAIAPANTKNQAAFGPHQKSGSVVFRCTGVEGGAPISQLWITFIHAGDPVTTLAGAEKPCLRFKTGLQNGQYYEFTVKPTFKRQAVMPPVIKGSDVTYELTAVAWVMDAVSGEPVPRQLRFRNQSGAPVPSLVHAVSREFSGGYNALCFAMKLHPDQTKTLFGLTTELKDPVYWLVNENGTPVVVRGQEDEELTIERCGEVRVYVDQAPPPAFYGSVPRFPRLGGMYASPLYRCETPMQLKWAQWTGIIPRRPSLTGLSGIPYPQECVNGIVVAYRDQDGQDPICSMYTPVGAVTDLSIMCREPVRSFRYQVLFAIIDEAKVGNVRDTPVFESIWLTFKRAGHVPAWLAWR